MVQRFDITANGYFTEDPEGDYCYYSELENMTDARDTLAEQLAKANLELERLKAAPVGGKEGR